MTRLTLLIDHTHTGSIIPTRSAVRARVRACVRMLCVCVCV